MRRIAVLAAAVLAAALPASAHAAWTAPAPVDPGDNADQLAQGAFGGSVVLGWDCPVASVAKRAGDAFSPPTPITVADPFEKVWDANLDADGNAVVLTIRKHLPLQRVRATFVTAAGARSGPMTISDHAHSAAGPELSVAPDGTAVAAWQWHDPAGWRVQAAVRLPGQARFGAPQTLSPPAGSSGRQQLRPWIHVAAGTGGRAALTWQIGGSSGLPETPLMVRTAGPDGVFGSAAGPPARRWAG